jgi:anaerobic selenocysteine-containing dehydrogenase
VTEAVLRGCSCRTDRDMRNGAKQQVSVEDSMSMVHLSRGSLHPPSDQVRSEVAIVCQLARTLLGPDHPVPWEQVNGDYDTIRDAIAAVVPGCDDYNREVRAPDDFPLPHAPRDSREFHTSTGKANFSVNPVEWVPVPPGRLILQTLRSHDQYNTTIYGLDDRYRGVKGGRRVVFVNPADLETFGLTDGDRIDLVSEFTNGDRQLQERRAKDFRVVAYSTPQGNAAAYYPDTNSLVVLDHVAAKSNTPVSKSIIIRLEAASGTERWGLSPRERGAHPPEGQGDAKGTRWGG